MKKGKKMSNTGRKLKSHPNSKPSIEKKLEQAIIKSSETGRFVRRDGDSHKKSDGHANKKK